MKMKRRLNQTMQCDMFLTKKFRPNLRDFYLRNNILWLKINQKHFYLLFCSKKSMLAKDQKVLQVSLVDKFFENDR